MEWEGAHRCLALEDIHTGGGEVSDEAVHPGGVLRGVGVALHGGRVKQLVQLGHVLRRLLRYLVVERADNLQHQPHDLVPGPSVFLLAQDGVETPDQAVHPLRFEVGHEDDDRKEMVPLVAGNLLVWGQVLHGSHRLVYQHRHDVLECPRGLRPGTVLQHILQEDLKRERAGLR